MLAGWLDGEMLGVLAPSRRRLGGTRAGACLPCLAGVNLACLPPLPLSNTPYPCPRALLVNTTHPTYLPTLPTYLFHPQALKILPPHPPTTPNSSRQNTRQAVAPSMQGVSPPPAWDRMGGGCYWRHPPMPGDSIMRCPCLGRCLLSFVEDFWGRQGRRGEER